MQANARAQAGTGAAALTRSVTRQPAVAPRLESDVRFQPALKEQGRWQRKSDRERSWHGGCREVLPLLPKHDLLTDPPYGIDGRDEHGRGQEGHGL